MSKRQQGKRYRDAKGRFRSRTRRNPILAGPLWDVGANVIAQHAYEKGMPHVRRHLAKHGVKSKLI